MTARAQSQPTGTPQVAILQTARLILRPLCPEDAADVFEYASDPEVTKHVRFPTHTSLQDTRAFLAASNDSQRKGDTMIWALTLKSTNKAIGTCGFVSWARESRRVELGYALNRNYWGQGYVAEAAAAIVQHGFTALNLN